MTKVPVINVEDVALRDWGHGDAFQARIGSVARAVGAERLGMRLVEVPAGKRAWPYHFHYVNEEMFYVLEGTGTLRYGGERYPIRAGDVISARAGTREGHQIINTSQAPLRYLAISTMDEPDVFEYPDSGKFGVYVGAAPGADEAGRSFSHFGRLADACDYWEGEE
jgi:uncharacterized cupin superfamily protein